MVFTEVAMERIEACEGFEVLQARGAARWAVYEDPRAMRGACDDCAAPLRGHYRLVVDFRGSSRRVCVRHPKPVVPRVTGIDIEGMERPRPGSWGDQRLQELLARGAA
jgi:hypothetical protein